MQIQNFIVLILFLVSAKAFAIGNVQTFATKNECLNSFITSTGNKDAVAGENYCKDKVVKSTIDICAETKLLDYKKTNSISATEEPRFLQKFKNECLQAAQQQQQNQWQQTQLVQQAALQPAQQSSTQQGSTAQQGQSSAPSNASSAASLARSLAPIIRDYARESDAKPAEKPVAKPVTPSDGNVSATNAGSVSSAPADTSNYSTVDLNSSPTFLNSPVLAPKDATTVVTTTGETTDKYGNVYDKNYTDQTHEDYTKEQQAKDQKEVADSGSTAAAAAPALAGTIASTQGAAAGGTAPASVITQASTATSQTLTSGAKTIYGKVQTNLTSVNPAAYLPFTKTLAVFQTALADIEKYAAATKTACTTSANTTEFLCMNGPGAQAAKKLMTAAGPVLAAFNSAQTACSSTAKVTRFAGAALTLAKGVCVAAKLSCDGLCGTAVADLNKTITTLPGLVKSAAATDSEMAAARCSESGIFLDPAEIVPCEQEAARKFEVALWSASELVALLQKENVVATPGTSAALTAGCVAKAADIALLVTDIAGLVAAKKSADECDKKLAADGGSGKTIAQYCDKSENSSTPFCKCQKNAQQEGCPGYVAPANKTDKPAEVAGLFLQNNGGLSSFAGSGPKGQLDPSKTISDSKNSNDPSADPNSLSSPDGSPSSPSGAIGGSPGSSGTRGSGSDANTKDDQAAKKKEWSFGAFASKLGGMFGGAKSSKASSGNGALNAKQEAAIKRKLASDKLAGEITSASGKSNWEKVRQAYLTKENSLLGQ